MKLIINKVKNYKMKRATIIISFITLFACNLNAQLDLSFKLGQGIYSMKNLKSFNETIIQSLPIKAKVVDNFPKTLFFEGDISYNKGFLYYGISYSHFSTGSRVTYSDYSGELTYDQILSSNSIGPIVKIVLNKTQKIHFIPYLSTKIIGTKYKLLENIKIFTQTNSKTTEFTSTGLILNFGMDVICKIRNAGFGVFCSYSIDSDNDLYKGDKKVVLDNNERFSTNWSGIRFGFTLLLDINMNSTFFKPKNV